MNLRVCILAAALSAVSASFGQNEPLIHNSFQDSDGGWTGMGKTAKTGLTHDAGVVDTGKGALKFDYGVKQGEMNFLMLPSAEGSLSKAKSLRFRVRACATTLMAVALQEQGEGRYVAMFYAPKDQWQTVELSTSDFVLSQEKDDPKDPDGKLDMDKVSAVVIADVAQIFMQGGASPITDLAGFHTGDHTMYLDDFSVGSDEVPPGFTAVPGAPNLDTFAHPQLAWFQLGGTSLARASGAPLNGGGLRADYQTGAGKIFGVYHPFAPGLLAGASKIELDLASKETSSYIVQVEATDGGKYNMAVTLDGSSKLQHLSLALDGFIRAEDSKDSAWKLEIGKIKSVLIMDVSGFAGGAEKPNTLWVGGVKGA